MVKTLMTREQRLNDAFMSGVATALCAEFIEVLKYIDGAQPYEEPCYGHLPDAVIRELGVPLVTGDIPGVAVILGAAPTAQEGVDLVKSYQAQGILVTLVGGIVDQCAGAGLQDRRQRACDPAGQGRDQRHPCSIRSYPCGPDLRQHPAGRRGGPDEVHHRACAGIRKRFRAAGSGDCGLRSGRHRPGLPGYHQRGDLPRAEEPDRAEGRIQIQRNLSGSQRYQDQDHEHRHPGGVRIRLRRRDHPEGRYAGRVRRIPCGLRGAGAYERHVRGRGPQDRS